MRWVQLLVHSFCLKLKCCWAENFQYYLCREFLSVSDFDNDNLFLRILFKTSIFLFIVKKMMYRKLKWPYKEYSSSLLYTRNYLNLDVWFISFVSTHPLISQHVALCKIISSFNKKFCKLSKHLFKLLLDIF